MFHSLLQQLVIFHEVFYLYRDIPAACTCYCKKDRNFPRKYGGEFNLRSNFYNVITVYIKVSIE